MKKTKLSKRVHKLKQKKPEFLLAYVLVVLVFLGAAGYVYANTDKRENRIVTFHDRGKDHVVVTKATTVDTALKVAKITLATGDVVEPALGSELLKSDSAILIYRARPVLVVDGAQKQKIMTAAASPNEILLAASMPEFKSVDKATFREGNLIAEGASLVLTIERGFVTPNTVPNLAKPTPYALTKSKGAQIFTDSNGVAHRETYYDLPMNVVIRACGGGDYTVRADGAKVDKDGYILIAASYRNYPKCTTVETSMGLGKVYDTGGFALRHPHGFDIATDWSNGNGR